MKLIKGGIFIFKKIVSVLLCFLFMFTLVDFGGFAKAAGEWESVELQSVTPVGTNVFIRHEGSNFPDVPAGLKSFKIDPPATGTYTNKDGLSVTLSFDGGTEGSQGIKRVSFTSSKPVKYVFVKGGRGGGGNLYKFEGSADSAKWLYCNIIKGDTYQNISHVTFYYEDPKVELGNLEVVKKISVKDVEYKPGNLQFKFILKKGDVTVAEGVIDEDGHYIFEGIEVGNYRLYEENYPEYISGISDEGLAVEVKKNVTTTLPEIVNIRKIYNITIGKRIVEDGAERPWQSTDPEFTFKLKEKSSENVIGPITSKNGIATFKDILSGEYELVEDNIMGYTVDYNGNQFILVGEKKETNFIVKNIINTVNPEPKGWIHVVKCLDDEWGPYGRGIDFKLYKVDPNDDKIRIGEPRQGTTDGFGSINFTDLDFGRYELEEVEAPEGYVKAKNIFINVLDSNVIVKRVVNKKEPVPTGSIKIVKKVKIGDNNPTSPNGVKFTFKLYELNGEAEELIGTDETNPDGILEITGLPIGKYILKEEGKEGYISGIGEKGIELTVEKNKTTEMVVVNTKIVEKDPVGSIRIVKAIKFGNNDPTKPGKLQFTFFLIKDGKVFKTGNTDAEGILTFDNLPVGEYVLEEASDDNYTTSLNSSNNKFTVKKDETTTVNVLNTLKEKPIDNEKPDEDEDLPNTGGFAEMELLVAGVGAFIILLGIRLRRARQ